MKNIWLVGCSSGIGLELLTLFLKSGNKVVASSRYATTSKALIKLTKEYKETLSLLDMDVSNNETIVCAVEVCWSLLGRVDILIFNAGVYEAMKCEDWNIENFEQMADINYLGAVRILNAALANLSEQNGARVVFNASLSSYFGLPFGSAYSASKAALVNFAESIQPEMAQKKIEIQVINHGFVKTRLTAKNDFEMPELMTPAFAAQKIYEGIAQAYRFEIKFPFKLSLFLTLLSMIPYSLSLGITKKFLK